MPSPTPTIAVPSASPTFESHDCITGCTFVAGGSYRNVSADYIVTELQLPVHFSLQFDVRIAEYPQVGNSANILEIVEKGTSNRLLEVFILHNNNIEVLYNGHNYVLFGPPLLQGNQFTTIRVGYSYGVASAWSTGSPGSVYQTPLSAGAEVNTAGKTYTLYASAPGVTSSGGIVKNFVVSGTFLYSLL